MDLENLARNVVNEFEGRFETSFSELNKLLAQCFDFARLFTAVCGTRVEGKTPVDRKKFSELGAHEFRKCVQYVSEMPHIKDKNLELGSELSSAVFCRAKKVFIEVMWGEMFASHFCKFFKKIMKKDNGDLSSEPLSIPDGIVMTTFQTSAGPQFSLSEVFEVELSNEEKMKVFFDDEALIEALYTDLSFYSALVKSFVLFLTSFMRRVVLKPSRNPSIGWWKNKKWKADRQSVS